mgnify:CR=1 FL=1
MSWGADGKSLEAIPGGPAGKENATEGERKAATLLKRLEGSEAQLEAARRAGMRAVALCTSHSAVELTGPHVMASVRNYHELMNQQFLENLHANA